MANIITVTSIGKVQSKKKGKAFWKEFTVEYTGDKGDKEKRFMSFDKEQYELGQSLEEDKSYEIQLEKDGEYWKWVGADEVDGDGVDDDDDTAKVKAKVAEKKATKAVVDWEKKDLQIARQSMIKAAVEFHSRDATAENVSFQDVIETAQEFVDYVYNGLKEVVVEDHETDNSETEPEKRGRGRPRKEPEVE